MPKGIDIEMTPFNFKRDCRNILRHIRTPIKRGGCMPYDTGRLRNQATNGRFVSNQDFTIWVSVKVAPYAEWLDDGTSPHNIPHSFGYPLPFGTSGRFDGKFHPGSKKHKGFITDDTKDTSILGYTLDYFRKHYNAEVKKG